MFGIDDIFVTIFVFDKFRYALWAPQYTMINLIIATYTVYQCQCNQIGTKDAIKIIWMNHMHAGSVVTDMVAESSSMVRGVDAVN